MSEKQILTAEQLAALVAFAEAGGRQWKRALRAAWEAGRDDLAPELRQLRNSHGPAWLGSFSFAKAAKEEGRDKARPWSLRQGSAPPSWWAGAARRQDEGATLAAIAAEHGVSRERVRQVIRLYRRKPKAEWVSKPPHRTRWLEIEFTGSTPALIPALIERGWKEDSRKLRDGITVAALCKPGTGIFGGWTDAEHARAAAEVDEVCAAHGLPGIEHRKLTREMV